MSGPEDAVAASSARAEPVDWACPCVACGYVLKGLERSGTCPECGTSVGASVRGDLLRFWPERILATVRAGLTLLLAGAGLKALSEGVELWAARTLGLTSGRLFLAADVLALAAAGAVVAGAWLFSAPTPATRGRGIERWMRAVSVVAAAAVVVEAAWLRQFIPGPPGVSVTLTEGVLHWVERSASVAVGGLALLHGSRLAERAGAPALERTCRTVAMLTPIAVFPLAAGGLVRGSVATPPAAWPVLLLVGVVGVVVIGWTVSLGIDLRRQIGRERAIGRRRGAGRVGGTV
jgi:hypothetical protein